MSTQASVIIVDGMVDIRLTAKTRAYILSLEVCSFCDRVSPCRAFANGWECIDHVGCAGAGSSSNTSSYRRQDSFRGPGLRARSGL